MLCPNCNGKHDGSCPTCHGHSFLVAPVEYCLADSIANAIRNRLLASGEELTTTAVTEVDFWISWASERSNFEEEGGWGYALKLAEKRAELTRLALQPILELGEVPLSEENMPKECTPQFWLEGAKRAAQERVQCQLKRLEITTVGSVTVSANLLMRI